MKSKPTGRLYFTEKYKTHQYHLSLIKAPADKLFLSSGRLIDLSPEDLPAWYVHGRFYKCFGYITAKGVKDMKYIPSRYSPHFLKDDCLKISYVGEIPPQQSDETKYDIGVGMERIWGNEILAFLKAAKKYSGYDISGIVEQIKEKRLRQLEENDRDDGLREFDIDAYFNDDTADN